MRARNWCFTLNNPDEELLPERWENIRCAIWQHEVGDEGTYHYQGYAEFTEPMRLGAVRALWGMERAHWERRLGSKEQAIAYCEKRDGTEVDGPWFYPDEATVRAGGEQGKRNDIEAALESLKRGATHEEMLDLHGVVVVKYHKGLDYARLHLPADDWVEVQKDCVLYWGPTGTGKSYRLRQECPEGPEWFWASPGKWFDGYEGQPGIVFDEIRDSWYTWEFLLRLIDVTPKRLEIKGGTVRCTATKFRMSTNVHPKGWYQGAKGKPNSPWAQSPLRRRFSRIVLMDQPVELEDDDIMAVEDLDEPPDEFPLREDEVQVLWANQ